MGITGNTRLLFEGFYTKKVLAVVSDYKGTVQQDYPNIKFMKQMKLVLMYLVYMYS